ncbi:MAG TPA: Sec-independent protein translocase protein TatB [Usitatibacter sp.]|jgi:sec-independent protein translocase protein TatB|nr:Sec-independent protein translocase protein TatB [Usitatibacter sp.]
MFDIGFSELFVIGVVALVVIGPERLPKVARTMGVLFGRLQRYVGQVKADINREMELAELGKVKTEFESAARSFQSEVESQASEAERELRAATEEIDRQVSTPAPEEASAAPGSPQLELGIEEPAAPRRDAPAP